MDHPDCLLRPLVPRVRCDIRAAAPSRGVARCVDARDAGHSRVLRGRRRIVDSGILYGPASVWRHIDARVEGSTEGAIRRI